MRSMRCVIGQIQVGFFVTPRLYAFSRFCQRKSTQRSRKSIWNPIWNPNWLSAIGLCKVFKPVFNTSENLIAKPAHRAIWDPRKMTDLKTGSLQMLVKSNKNSESVECKLRVINLGCWSLLSYFWDKPVGHGCQFPSKSRTEWCSPALQLDQP